MTMVFIKGFYLISMQDIAINPDSDKALFSDPGQDLFMSSLFIDNKWCQQNYLCPFR